ncbi:S-adenosyl-L-methionine-dependent methyltransferase [Lepidopterella palustris CBS 459.81]|uniref:S-adenosyl-L-methionine-dependent methyltransferase n=1 Tax=Lepidopterella palustris CBS 459.81 TaxID=1314670 RepID=A0A8E2EA03_9PEZI|nr:S-adenosyl-L-methionine-dependent methyltransferase [Lepidopterella palustris CBS 459.81]
MSVTDSVYNYRYENGRRYHAYSDGKYPVPNDEVEKDRLDLQHHAFRLTLDGALYIAPIPKDVQNVLDIGCGTGIWTIEFAEEHPSAKVLGTDLSPIQPVDVPPNCSFLIDDADNDWVFHSPFDFIHTRAMVAAFKNWSRFFEQSYANLKPGGYLEVQEFYFPPKCTDPTLTPETSPLLQWGDNLTKAGSLIGMDMEAAASFAEPLRAAGFVDIHAKHFKWPVGPWAKGEKNKLLGRFAMEDLNDWLPSSAMALFTRVLKWTREEVELFLATVRKELKEEKQRHFWANVVFWYARKPLDAGVDQRDQDLVREEVMLEDDNAPEREESTEKSANAASEKS